MFLFKAGSTAGSLYFHPHTFSYYSFTCLIFQCALLFLTSSQNNAQSFFIWQILTYPLGFSQIFITYLFFFFQKDIAISTSVFLQHFAHTTILKYFTLNVVITLLINHSEQENKINFHFQLINFYIPSMVLCAFTYMIKFNSLSSVTLVVSKPFLHEEKKR